MKRHVQYTGVRRWAGDDLMELQSEALKVLDAFFAQYGNIIISGCEIEGNTVKPGIVGLRGLDSANNEIFKVVPFAGRNQGNTFPVYLKLDCKTVQREYGDGKVKPIAYDYFAAISNTVPEGKNYIIIDRAESKRFIPQAVKDVVDSIDSLLTRFGTKPNKPVTGDILVANGKGLVSSTGKKIGFDERGNPTFETPKSVPDILNVSELMRDYGYSTPSFAAKNDVPATLRKRGLIITYHTHKGSWVIEQFVGDSIDDWTDYDKWKNWEDNRFSSTLTIICDSGNEYNFGLDLLDEGAPQPYYYSQFMTIGEI